MDRRLEQLLHDGHVARIMTFWEPGDTWTDAGYGITPSGRDAIEATPD